MKLRSSAHPLRSNREPDGEESVRLEGEPQRFGLEFPLVALAGTVCDDVNLANEGFKDRRGRTPSELLGQDEGLVTCVAGYQRSVRREKDGHIDSSVGEVSGEGRTDLTSCPYQPDPRHSSYAAISRGLASTSRPIRRSPSCLVRYLIAGQEVLQLTHVVRLVIFDCDGVLVDSEVLTVPIDQAALAELGWGLTLDEAALALRWTNPRGLPDQVTEWLGRPPDESWVDRLRQHRRDALTGVHAVPGVLEVLVPAIRAMGVEVCVASSGTRARIRRSLESVGLLGDL